MEREDQPPDQTAPDAPPDAGDLGEDHREGAPGYDLDEQRAIQELERERARHQDT
jgi:hypothetical protein